MVILNSEEQLEIRYGWTQGQGSVRPLYTDSECISDHKPAHSAFLWVYALFAWVSMSVANTQSASPAYPCLLHSLEQHACQSFSCKVHG